MEIITLGQIGIGFVIGWFIPIIINKIKIKGKMGGEWKGK